MGSRKKERAMRREKLSMIIISLLISLSNQERMMFQLILLIDLSAIIFVIIFLFFIFSIYIQRFYIYQSKKERKKFIINSIRNSIKKESIVSVICFAVQQPTKRCSSSLFWSPLLPLFYNRMLELRYINIKLFDFDYINRLAFYPIRSDPI